MDPKFELDTCVPNCSTNGKTLSFLSGFKLSVIGSPKAGKRYDWLLCFGVQTQSIKNVNIDYLEWLWLEIDFDHIKKNISLQKNILIITIYLEAFKKIIHLNISHVEECLIKLI